jgi:hypothetical protein
VSLADFFPGWSEQTLHEKVGCTEQQRAENVDEQMKSSVE